MDMTELYQNMVGTIGHLGENWTVKLAGAAYGNPDILASYRVLTGSTTGNKLGLVAKQFRFYRGYLRQSLPTALVNTLRWGISGLGKFS